MKSLLGQMPACPMIKAVTDIRHYKKSGIFMPPPLKKAQSKASDRNASTKEKLLKAALLEFAEHGIKAAKIAVICRRADVANGTFYLYFRTKEDVWKELLKGAAEELALRLQQSGAAENLDARTRDRIEVSIIVGFAEERSDLYMLMMGERTGQVTAHDLFLSRLHVQRCTMIEKGIANGEFRSNLNPTITSLADFGMATEIIQWWIHNPGSMTREEVTEHLVDLRARMFFPD
ncbi:MAG: TetR/AcrR family transcriptional regulator [Sphingorhabdus sp.]